MATWPIDGLRTSCRLKQYRQWVSWFNHHRVLPPPSAICRRPKLRQTNIDNFPVKPYQAWFKNGHFGVTRACRFLPVLIGNSRVQCHAEGGLPPPPPLVRLAGVELAPGRAA